jgi:pseudaminic acid synthase
MKIGHFNLTENGRVMLIAELSANHNHRLDVAIDTIRAAAKAGADAIKLQTYTADTLTIDCDNEHFRIGHGTLWDGKTLYNLYKEAYTPWEWHAELYRIAREEGLVCFSSPFDATAVDFLEALDTPAHKIASFEIQDIPLIRYAASKGKPIIISTGIAMEEDVRLAVETCRAAGNGQIVLLKCTSAYPAPLEEANLRTMQDLRERFGVMVGVSDHTMDHTVPVVATALGGCLIEKHFILDRNLGGPDAAFSLDPAGFAEMARQVRDVETALGRVSYERSELVEKNRKFARSLFVVDDVKAGEAITAANVRSIRPGFGLHPRYYDTVLGKTFTRDIVRGTPLSADHIAGFSA